MNNRERDLIAWDWKIKKRFPTDRSIFPTITSETGKTAPIKKAAANAAAKVRRWIKELQINVSEHQGDKPKYSIHLKSFSNGLSCSKACASCFTACPVKARSEYGFKPVGKIPIPDMHCYGACNSHPASAASCA
nr:hypothetical protein [uncultured Pseudomonas sp.]